MPQRLRTQLQFPLGLVGFPHRRLGLRIASAAPLASITERFVTAVRRFAADHDISTARRSAELSL